MKNWPKPKSIREIQVFHSFANFYWRFIQSFSKIAQPFTLIFKIRFITKLSKNLLSLINVAKVDKVGVGVGDGDYKDKMIGRLPFKNLNKDTGYLTPNAR